MADSTEKEDTYIVPSSSAQHTHTIILLHGRDSSAAEFASELFESQASDDRTLLQIFPTVKWVFPDAGLRAAARFGGAELNQWFDVWSVEELDEEGELHGAAPGLGESVERVRALVKAETQEVGGASKVVLGGISMGCATAARALLSLRRSGIGGGSEGLAGFVGWCGWLPQAGAEGNEKNAPSLAEGGVFRTPIFLAHCKDDEMVPVGNGEKMRRALEATGWRVEWHAYEDGGHWVHEPQGVDDMAAFIQSCFREADPVEN